MPSCSHLSPLPAFLAHLLFLCSLFVSAPSSLTTLSPQSPSCHFALTFYLLTLTPQATRSLSPALMQSRTCTVQWTKRKREHERRQQQQKKKTYLSFIDEIIIAQSSDSSFLFWHLTRSSSFLFLCPGHQGRPCMKKRKKKEKGSHPQHKTNPHSFYYHFLFCFPYPALPLTLSVVQRSSYDDDVPYSFLRLDIHAMSFII